jgi:hypothetical protein
MDPAKVTATSNENKGRKMRNFMETKRLLREHVWPLNCMFLERLKQGFVDRSVNPRQAPPVLRFLNPIRPEKSLNCLENARVPKESREMDIPLTISIPVNRAAIIVQSGRVPDPVRERSDGIFGRIVFRDEAGPETLLSKGTFHRLSSY